MNAVPPKPVHESYQRHRRQRTTQIILPVVLAVLLCIGMVVLINIATFRGNGDVGRWAAISTMWIVLPVFVTGLVFLALLAGIIYLLARLLGIAPTYTVQAQDFIRRLAMRIHRAADATVKPVIYLDGIGASIRTFFGGRK
jgi:predicted PurR-regulated permease PerM